MQEKIFYEFSQDFPRNFQNVPTIGNARGGPLEAEGMSLLMKMPCT